MEVRIAHTLAPLELSRRIAQMADVNDVELQAAPGGLSGTLIKDSGFLGRVSGEYTIEPGTLVVRVLERPAFLPEGSLRRMLEEQLGKLVVG